MSGAEMLGSLGVAILLFGFALNVAGKIGPTASIYHALNAVGATLAALASYWIGFWPFVVLETAWAGVATVAWFRGVRR